MANRWKHQFKVRKVEKNMEYYIVMILPFYPIVPFSIAYMLEGVHGHRTYGFLLTVAVTSIIVLVTWILTRRNKL